MLYLVGGAARAGKTTLAHRMLGERQVPYLSLDVLMMGLANGVPAFGMNPDDSALARGERLWPLLRAMLINLFETGTTYLLEGDLLLPRYVAEFVAAVPHEARAVFLGFAESSAEQKAQAIRMFPSAQNDWTRGLPESELITLAREMVELSQYLRHECALYGLPYFDVSRDTAAPLDAAFHALTAM